MPPTDPTASSVPNASNASNDLPELRPEARRFAPATERNREPILTVLRSVLPAQGTILEVASGTGQHAVFFGNQLWPRQWQPSEPMAELRNSIRAWQQAEPSEHMLPPLDLDVMRSPWPVEMPEYQARHATLDTQICAIVNINMIHISPWDACLALLAGAGRILPPAGILYLYGPFKRQGQHTAPSNAAFDQSLQGRNPHWGIRNLETVIEAAQPHQLYLHQFIEMPANNLSVVLQKKEQALS